MKLLNRCIIILILLFTNLDCYSQNNPCQGFDYQKTYWNSFSNHPSAIINTSDGGNVIVGNITDFWMFNDAFILKINVQGNVVWAKKVGTGNADQFTNGIETADGGYLAIGQTSSYGTIISKFSGTGDLLWTKTFSTLSSFNHKPNIVELPTGGYAITCVYVSPLAKAMVLRIDNTGNVTWAKSYNISPSLVSMSNSIEVENDSLVVSGYYETGPLQQDQHRFLMKVGINDGTVFWAKRWSNAGADLFRDMYKKNGFYYANHKSGSVDHVSTFNTDGTVVNSFSLNSTINDNQIRNFYPTMDTGIIIPSIDLTSKNFNLVKVKGSQVTSARSFQLQPSLMGSAPKTVQSNTGEFVTVIGVTPLDYLGLCIIKTALSSNGNTCISNPVNISAVPAVLNVQSFTWTNVLPENIIASNLNLSVSNISFYGDTQCATSGFGCSQATISGSDTICRSQSPTIYKVPRSAGCTSPVAFSIDPAIARTVANTDSTVSLIFLQEGITKLYSQFVTTCGTVRDSLTITIKKHADSLSLGNDKTVCGNVNLTIDAGPGFKSYLWQNGSINQAQHITAAGMYHVRVTDYCDNVFTDSIVVSVAAPGILDLGPDISICAKDSVTLSATQGFNNYTWFPVVNLISNASSAIVFPVNTTKYYVSAESSPGCIWKDSVLVSIYPTPGINLGADTSICSGDSKTLNAGAGFTQYLWNTGATSQQIVSATAGRFYVIATDVNGCRAKDSLSILAVHPTPLVTLSNDTLLCHGTAMTLDAGAGQQSYLWQNGSSNQTLNVTGIGTYWVRVTSSNNCLASDTAHVKTIVPTPIDFIISDTSICSAASTILQPTQVFTSYLWSTGETANSITVSLPGNYWLEVINSNGCKARENIVVKTKDCVNRIFFPNAFTPNADGRNDVFRSTVSGVLVNYSLAVYNRYGQLVFSTKDYTEGWGGLLKGREQHTGSFTWYSIYQFLNEPPASQKGTILLIR